MFKWIGKVFKPKEPSLRAKLHIGEDKKPKFSLRFKKKGKADIDVGVGKIEDFLDELNKK